ncbi:MAG: hypothetical protein JW818_11075 [Pirellulales bacterium]|nr:hypothetical protein [Pirellulales bacterium]
MSGPDMQQSVEPRLAAQVRTMQIIVFALVMGCVCLAAVALVFRATNGDEPPEMPLISYVALAFAGTALIARTIVLTVMGNQGRTVVAQEAADLTTEQVVFRFAGLYQTQLMIGSALLEGASFFLLVSYLVEGWIVSPIVAGVLVVGIALHLPTTSRVSTWIKNQVEIIEQEQHLR